MKKLLVLSLVLSITSLVACKKSSPTSTNANKSADAVQQKLQELAGSGATDCGRVKSQEASVVQPASECAMKAAESRQAFFVAYDLPGMTTAVAGNLQGNLFSVQAQEGKSGATTSVDSSPCPSALRLAQSGRVTCYPPGGMGGMPTGTSPHGGMGMPPATGQSPHGGMPQTGQQNPHGEAAAPSHGKTNPK